ncbi:hypothetical protein ACFQZI_10580 [Mucilaginibacter lutimaris]|uniref:Uncharacterized protein n=1 Tax=Mucilaginibacter lutimaris TaxID=931629 RepID=A0ABW2ZGL4_9SPHI
MKNSIKTALLTLAIAVTAVACDPAKKPADGVDSTKTDSVVKVDSTVKKDTVVKGADTVKVDTTKK